MSNDSLVSDRDCGECTACCVTLRIEESQLRKAADVPCPHLKGQGCSIYADRPQVCRSWYCGWRYLAQLGDEWRPDRSKVLIRLREEPIPGVILQPLEAPEGSLTAIAVLEIIGGFVDSSVPLCISLPTREGYTYAQLELNDLLAEGVAARDLRKTRLLLLEAIRKGQQVPTDPVEPIDSGE
jgi:hypothetical protein